MATTPNYGFIMPDPTDLVTDLPADFEIFGDEVDLRVKALNPETTEGDLAYRGATADAKDRLGIGTAGQVLAVNSGADAPEWVTIAAPAGFSPDLVLINAGGTTLTGSSTSITGLGGYSTYLVDLDNVGSTNANAEFKLRVNSDSGFNYIRSGNRQSANNTYSAGIFESDANSADDGIQLGFGASAAASRLKGSVLIFGGDAAARSIYIQHTGMTNAGGSTGQQTMNRMAFHERAAAISSMQIVVSSGTLVGTVRIYGAV